MKKALRVLVFFMSAIVVGLFVFGCASDKVVQEARTTALKTRADVFERQHEALTVLLYQKTVNDLKLDEAQAELLKSSWEERRLMEFWNVQWERANAMEVVVDEAIAAHQNSFVLLGKELSR